MKIAIGALAVLAVGMMAPAADAQFVYYEHSGRHHRVGVGLSFGPSYSSYYDHGHATYYTPPSYYAPAYGYHTHHADTQVTPYGGSTTTYDHFGQVHAPSRTTTYHYPSYYTPYSRSTYYWR